MVYATVATFLSIVASSVQANSRKKKKKEEQEKQQRLIEDLQAELRRLTAEAAEARQQCVANEEELKSL